MGASTGPNSTPRKGAIRSGRFAGAWRTLALGSDEWEQDGKLELVHSVASNSPRLDKARLRRGSLSPRQVAQGFIVCTQAVIDSGCLFLMGRAARPGVGVAGAETTMPP